MKTRWLHILGLIAIFPIAYLYFGISFGYGFSCGLGSSYIECYRIGELLQWIFVSTILTTLLLGIDLVKLILKKPLVWTIYFIVILNILVLVFGPQFIKTIPVGNFDCSNIKRYPQQSYCYTEMAQWKKNVEYCRQISPQDEPTKWTCITLYAKSANDPGVCNEAGRFSDICYQDVAFTYQHSDVCSMIGNPASLKTCYESLNISATTTSSVDIKAQIKNAAQSKTEQECNDLTSYEKRNCLLDLALIKLDISFAERICKQESAYESCMQGFLMDYVVYINNSQLCSYFKENSAFKVDCITHFASKTSNPSLCNQLVNLGTVNDGQLKANCFVEVAVDNENTAYCSYVPSEYSEYTKTCIECIKNKCDY